MYVTHANDYSFDKSLRRNTALETPEDKGFRRVFHRGNAAMFIAVLGMFFSVYVGYIDAESYSLWAQVASHILLILFATAIKIGYVMRCIGLQGLGATQL